MDSEETKDEIEEINLFNNVIFWILFSLISSIIFAKYSKGACTFLFLSFSWIFIWTLFTQAWSTMERDPKDVGYILSASLAGWIIGTIFVWKKKNWRNSFFEK